MAALATLVFVWLNREKPEGRMKAALDEWVAARGETLEPPRSESTDKADASKAIAEHCDRALEDARDQLNAEDDDGATRTLARLEQTLRDHPELLQASWLMAERYRLEAQIAVRSGFSADRWLEAAEALEGARASAFGESDSARRSTAALPASVLVHGARTHETYWDGVRVGDPFFTSPGEHHLAIVRGKRVAWSGWVSAFERATFDVWIPDAAPCSAEDLEGATFAGDGRVTVPKGVRCGAWMAASPGANSGTLRAALCREDQCQPTVTLAYDVMAASHTESASSHKGLPAWASWTLAGLGFVAATTLIMWRTGAFDRAEPPPRVGYDGSGL